MDYDAQSYEIELTLTDDTSRTLTVDSYHKADSVSDAIADRRNIRLTGLYAPGPERYVNGAHVLEWTVTELTERAGV